MNDGLAIAAVTAALRKLLLVSLQSDVDESGITTRPPDVARAEGETSNQLNLFLYLVVTSERRVPSPLAGMPHRGSVPMPVDLHYLLTAYTAHGVGTGADVAEHRLLGKAMHVLRSHPVLTPEEIRTALPDTTPAGGPAEPVRVAAQNLSLAEMTSLWRSFGTPYRTSMAYVASVVPID